MTLASGALLSLPADDTPVALAADLYVAAGMAPIQIYGLTSARTCVCRLGPECRTPGKHPIGDDWKSRASLDVDAVRDRFRGYHGNIGVSVEPSGLVLIDADGAEGVATVATWDLPPTLTQQSGSGVGAHYIYRLAADQDAGAISDRRVEPGVDVKAHGQFVAAPSRHASGGVYRWTNMAPIATLPDEIFARIRKRRVEPTSGVMPTALPSDPNVLYDRAAAYLAKIPSAISGSGGHNQTFAAARALAGYLVKGLPESYCWGLLCEYNRRCEPPWTERELAHKWTDAKNAERPVIIQDRPLLRSIAGGRARPAQPPAPAAGDEQPPGGTPPAPPSPPPPPEPDWRAELLYVDTRKGNPKLVSHAENVIRILQLCPEWIGRIRYDAFRARIVLHDPPWDEYQRPTTPLGYWTDEDNTRLSAWLRRRFHRDAFDPDVTVCDRAVRVVARRHDFNPVRDYLDGCEWDGISRLPQWLSTYLGAEPGEYARLVGAWWLISAVARIYDPGCKVDTVPILEGGQGIRKSSTLRVLAGDWFNDTPIDLNSKDAYTAIQGCWFVELAELDSLMRAEPSRSKAFFASSKDRFRRAYARHDTDELRQCIFVGTTNLVEYLGDPTGARRYFPIRCGRIDLEALQRDRDQLWAEAVHEYREGRPWYPQSDAERALMSESQEARMPGDAWEPKIRAYLQKTGVRQTRVSELLEHALQMHARDWTRSAEVRIGQVMIHRLGWSKRRISESGARPWIYELPDA